MKRNCLIVMARYPTPGRVKTRLARSLGAAPACSLYLAFLQDLARRFARGPASLLWAYTPAQADFGRFAWLRGQTMPQRGRTLGERMLNAVGAALRAGHRRVVLIGSDAPQIRRQWVEDAFAALATKDVVFGPAADGGYYLVGLRAGHDIFSGIRWGASTVLARSLARAKKMGLQVQLVAPTFDVDRPADLRRLWRAAAADRRGLGHTRRALRALGFGP